MLGFHWVVFALLVFSVHCRASYESGESRKRSPAKFVANEFLIELGESLSLAEVSGFTRQIARKLGAEVESIRTLATSRRFQLVKLRKGSLVENVMRELKSKRGVKYVEKNLLFRKTELPNDERMGFLWGLKNVGQADDRGRVGKSGADIDVLPVWDMGITGSRSVLVAVIDTGIDFNHPDLVSNIFRNSSESGPNAINGLDDDGNGFVDDTSGWNFSAGNNVSMDDNGHGTHCAGTIGATGNNGIGVAGVNWSVSLLPIKFLDSNGGGTLANAVEAIEYAQKMGAHVINASWGAAGESNILADAVRRTQDSGIIFVAAAGNNAVDISQTPFTPASIDSPNVIAVGALDNGGRMAPFSNYSANKVHVMAPGSSILSTVPGAEYKYLSGTSMAAPHVAGIVALLKSTHPEWGFDEVKRRLIETSQPTLSLSRRTVSHGRVSAVRAVRNELSVDAEPPNHRWTVIPVSVESSHPYSVRENSFKEFHVPNALYLRLLFEKIEMEPGYDYLKIVMADLDWAEAFTGTKSNFVSASVPGNRIRVQLLSDEVVQKWGYKITEVHAVFE